MTAVHTGFSGRFGKTARLGDATRGTVVEHSIDTLAGSRKPPTTRAPRDILGTAGTFLPGPCEIGASWQLKYWSLSVWAEWDRP